MSSEIKLENMNDLAAQNIATYCDDRMAFIEDWHHIDLINPVRTGVVAGVVCLKGKASLYVNGESYALQANDMLICNSNVVLEKSMVSADVDFRCICFSPEYIKQLGQVSNNSWEVMRFLEETPILSLKQEEVNLFCQYYDLIRSKLMGTPCQHQKEVVDALMVAFMYEFHDCMERFIQLNPPKYSTGEERFKEFIEMLASSFPKDRRIGVYASRLCITPKYLSAICKKYTGKTASDVIDQYVLKDVLYQLKKTNKPIKAIADNLGFSDVSFFGKFVKRYTGLSPKQYREQLRNNPDNTF